MANFAIDTEFSISNLSTDINDVKIDAEIDMLRQRRSLMSNNQAKSFVDSLKEFSKPQLYKPFAIMVLFFAIQQFSGIFIIFVYAAKFSIEAGVNIDEFLSTVIIGATRCFGTFLVAFVADKFGRKTLTIVSGCGMFVSVFGIAICTMFSVKGTNASWIPNVLLFSFILFGTAGILTLPFAIIAEIYPQKSRGMASGITIGIAFSMAFLMLKTFLVSLETFGSTAVFFFYSIISLIGVAFGYFVLPETKGKSLQEIENHFVKKH